MTVVTVPLVRRPLDWAMFADITDAKLVKLSGCEVVFDGWLSPDQIVQVRVRLMTADDNDEQTVLKASDALQANQDFLALGSPTAAQVVAQVQALTRQVDAVIKFALQ